jgi:hypothetical protein
MDASRENKIVELRREIDLLRMEEHRLLRLTSMEREDSAFIGEINYHLATTRHKLRDASRDLTDLESGK